MSFNGLLINRLLVLFQIIFIPTYFIIYTILWNELLIKNLESFLNLIPFFHLNHLYIQLTVILGIPIFFALPGVIFSILRANKLANTYELMGRALGKVRIDQKLFYGVNALFVLIFIILPFGSPLITILVIFLVIRIMSHKMKIGKFSWLIWFIPALALSIIPILIAGAFYVHYLDYWNIVFQIWLNNIDLLFGFGLSLAIAIVIGDFILFLMIGSYEYGNRSNINYGFIYLLKLGLFLLLLLIYLQDSKSIIFTIANGLALVLGILEFILSRVKKVSRGSSSGVGFIMIPVFTIVNFVSQSLAIKGAVIVIAAVVFFTLFIISYTSAEDEELFSN